MFFFILVGCGQDNEKEMLRTKQDVCLKRPYPNKETELKCIEQDRIRSLDQSTDTSFGNREIK
jgi:hypothetical protein